MYGTVVWAWITRRYIVARMTAFYIRESTRVWEATLKCGESQWKLERKKESKSTRVPTTFLWYLPPIPKL